MIDGKALRIIMVEKEINKKTLAEHSGVKSTTLYKIIKGEANPTLSVIHKISTALDMTPEQFVKVFMNSNKSDPS